MRVVLVAAIAVLLGACPAVKAQEETAEPAVAVHSLVINASDLPATETRALAQKFQGGKYVPEELAERVLQAVRDKGYFEAKCRLDGVKDSEDGQTADIQLRITAGSQYRLAGIRFTGSTLFPAQQARSLFEIEDGALFNATAIGRGLERLKDLYAEAGYINVGGVPTPQIDESRHTVALTIDVDQGKQFYFGRLLLDGVEPKAGTAQSLQTAWASLHPKPYSPKVLNDWLTAHAPYWPGGGQPIDHVKSMQNPETQQVDVVVQFP